MKRISPTVAAIPPVLFLFGFLAFVLGNKVKKENERKAQASESEEVLEFRLLKATQLDDSTKKPVFHPSLKKLDGERVVIAGYMTPTPAAEAEGGFRRFRLVENAPGILLRPPAANEGMFVEQRMPREGAPADANLFPKVDGSIAVRGVLRLAGYGGENPGLEKGYWFAIEEAVIDRLGAP